MKASQNSQSKWARRARRMRRERRINELLGLSLVALTTGLVFMLVQRALATGERWPIFAALAVALTVAATLLVLFGLRFRYRP